MIDLNPIPPVLPGCKLLGGVNRGGLRNSRGYRFQFGVFGYSHSPITNAEPGTESGFPASIIEGLDFVQGLPQPYFGCFNSFRCSFLKVHGPELRLQIRASYYDDILLGMHSTGTGDAIFEGATIPNSITGTGSYRYRIVASTEQEVREINAASIGVSLKDCGGTYFAPPDSPWTAEVEADEVPPAAGSFFDNFPNSVWGPYFPNGTIESWSNTFTATTLTSAVNNEPLLWTLPATSVPYLSASGVMYGVTLESLPGTSLRIATALNAAVAPYSFGGSGNPFSNPGGAACAGCQVRYQASGVLSRTRILSPFTGSQGGFVPTLSGAYVQDILYFDDVLSPCFNAVSDATWEMSPTRRQIYLGYWAGGFSYPQTFYTSSPATVTVTIKP
jgi:hypothetical protein